MSDSSTDVSTPSTPYAYKHTYMSKKRYGMIVKMMFEKLFFDQDLASDILGRIRDIMHYNPDENTYNKDSFTKYYESLKEKAKAQHMSLYAYRKSTRQKEYSRVYMNEYRQKKRKEEETSKLDNDDNMASLCSQFDHVARLS